MIDLITMANHGNQRSNKKDKPHVALMSHSMFWGKTPTISAALATGWADKPGANQSTTWETHFLVRAGVPGGALVVGPAASCRPRSPSEVDVVFNDCISEPLPFFSPTTCWKSRGHAVSHTEQPYLAKPMYFIWSTHIRNAPSPPPPPEPTSKSAGNYFPGQSASIARRRARASSSLRNFAPRHRSCRDIDCHGVVHHFHPQHIDDE